MRDATTFTDLNTLASHLRQELENKKFILLYAYNGTGKTRLSTAFKSLGKVVNTDGETEKRDTLYFNAFTEDLSTSTPSPRTCSCGTTISRMTASGS